MTIKAVAAKPGTSPQEYDVNGAFTATLVAYPSGASTDTVTIDITF
ncbi:MULTISPECIES: hypothetical protein [Anaeromyxobacter]|nr:MULTISPECIES: hypothetical protein [unclassified Anaeromyxobacter]